MLKTRTWVFGIAAAAVLLAILSLWTAKARKPGRVVQIMQNNVVIQEIDLSRVTEEYRFTVEDGRGGHNTILVQPERICVSEADCPDQICVLQGWLSDEALPIVCLPHRLVIMLKEPAGPTGSDAAAG